MQFLYSLNLKFKPLAIFCECTAEFVSDLVGNPEDRFSRDTDVCVADWMSDNTVKTNNFAMKKLILFAYLFYAFCEFIVFAWENL